MKKTTLLIKTLLCSGLILLVLGTSSCKKEVKEEDPKEVATEQNEEKFDANDNKEDDSAFLVAAAETDLMEIEIGKLAQTKGTDAGVKEFGKMLVTDHSKSAEDTKPLADKLQVSLPTSITEKGKEHYNELNEKKAGQEFDEKFSEMMVKGHEDAVSKMQDAAEKANNPEIRAWAANMVPTLKMHLEHAKGLKAKIENKK
jgi:putative membrane protein